MAGEREVVKFIKEAVPDWDEEAKATARFKAFSGQRCDWEPRFCFWRDLIINIARRFNLVFLSPSQMKNCWFNRGGLTPLCLDHVLLEMYKAGYFLRTTDLADPTSGRLSQLVRKMMQLSGLSTYSTHNILDDRLILLTTLEDKAADVVKALSETHWTPSCIITMTKFESLFRDPAEAFTVLSYMSGQGKAKYLTIKTKQQIQGVKVSLSSAATSSISSVDSDILRLVWTVEELQQQLDVIDKQYERSRKSALAALASGNKKVALRNARQLKLASESREKVLSYLNRVEGVLGVISDAESTKKVSEAIQIGVRAIKENRMEVEEVELCLQELDELLSSQEEVKKALETYTTEDNEDIEEELQKLEAQLRDENLASTSNFTDDVTEKAEKASASVDSLISGVASLELKNEPQNSNIQKSPTKRDPRILELA